jgi:hypothetical protein
MGVTSPARAHAVSRIFARVSPEFLRRDFLPADTLAEVMPFGHHEI